MRKTQGPQYSREDLRKAVKDVLNKNKTEDFYGVPKVSNFIEPKGDLVVPVLSEETEKDLIKARARSLKYSSTIC